MKKTDFAVKPVLSYHDAMYPSAKSTEAEDIRRRIGKKLGAVLLAGTLGLTLTGCRGCTVGPPPIRPDFQTESDAKRSVDEAQRQKDLENKEDGEQGAPADADKPRTGARNEP